MTDEQPEILMESVVASDDLEPMVHLRWGSMSGRLSPDETRQHALRLLATAEAAEHDSALMRWMSECLDVEPFELLGDLRVHRGTRRPEGS